MKRCPQCGKNYAGEANFCPVDAGRLEVIPDDAPKDADEHVLGGRFLVGDPIGGGLTGQVFKATDKQSGYPCVVKWVDPEVFSSPLQMQRTERELKQLERQEAAGIARVLAHGRRDDRLWIASEYVAGTALDQLIASVGPLPLDRATKIVHDVGVALAEAAKLGVIHRDVAPKNVLVGDGDEIHVINFGVAVPATPSVRGLPEYVAPEQVDGKPVDQRSNIYSLGAMLFAILTGRPPFEGDAESVHNAHLHSNPPAASEIESSVPEPVDKLIERALAKQSSKRFMTLRQLLAELEKVAGLEPASTQRMGAAKAKKSEGKRRKKDIPAEASQTLLGVAAFERPDAAAAVPVAAASASVSGAAALAPPVTEPPPVASVAPASMPPVEPASANGSNTTLRDLPPPGEAASPSVAVSSEDALATSGQIGDSDSSDETGDEVVATNALASAEAAGEAGEHDATTEMKTNAAREAEQAPEAAEPKANPVLIDERPRSARVSEAAETAEAGASTSLGASGKRRRRKKKKKKANKFRETMWFKKGELDEAAAEAAAAASANDLVSAKADEMTEDERYKDDGSITAEDQDRLSLRTGHTQMMSAMKGERPSSGGTSSFSEDELVDEMKGGVGRWALVGVALLIVVSLIIYFVAT